MNTNTIPKAGPRETSTGAGLAESETSSAAPSSAAAAISKEEQNALEWLSILFLAHNRRLIRAQIIPDVLKAALKHGWVARRKGDGRWDDYYVPAGHLEELIGTTT